jgi:hypothetical protein
MVELGILPADKALKWMDLGHVSGVHDRIMASEDQANREIEKLIKGHTLNPESVQAAISSLQQGINPETGEAFSGDPAEAQYLIQRASLMPGPVDNHETHYDVLSFFMTGVEFENLPPEVRERFYIHAELTQQAMNHLPQVQAEAPRVNLQVKATTGPTAMAKILRSSGVDVTEQDTSEPPLETWVTDSVDKPDADAAGPGQEAEHLSKAAQQMMDVKLKAVEVQEKQALESDSHEADQRRAEELHSEALRAASADADTAEKKAKESSFKPQPKPKGN